MPFMEAMYKKAGGDVAGSRAAALLEGEQDPSAGENAGPGILLEIGITGSLLSATWELDIVTVVLGSRFGTVVVKAAIGLKTTLAALGARIGFAAIRDTTDLNGRTCAIAGGVGIPGLPVDFIGVGVAVLFGGFKFAGIAIDAVVGPSVDLGLPVGGQLQCFITREWGNPIRRFFGRSRR